MTLLDWLIEEAANDNFKWPRACGFVIQDVDRDYDEGDSDTWEYPIYGVRLKESQRSFLEFDGYRWEINDLGFKAEVTRYADGSPRKLWVEGGTTYDVDEQLDNPIVTHSEWLTAYAKLDPFSVMEGL